MIPLFTSRQVREADSFAINQLGIPGSILMENASLNIFRAILRNYPYENLSSMLIVCGKGNNGGDGFALARHFANEGVAVDVIHFGNNEDMYSDAFANYNILVNLEDYLGSLNIKRYTSPKDFGKLSGYDIIVDAILGSGAKGELKEPYAGAVKKLNEAKAYKVAVDIPTGLDVETGFGDVIFKADLTVTLAELKTGLFHNSGYIYCGKVVKEGIGLGGGYFDSLPVDDYLIEPEDAYRFLPVKDKGAYKYSAGKVLTIAGSGKLPGAAVLTSKAEFKSGCGASILAFPEQARKLVAKNLTEVITEPYNDEGKDFLTTPVVKTLEKRLKWADVTAMGPGLGREEETVEAVLKIIKKRLWNRLVLDADAIYALNGNYKKYNLKDVVLTPHHAEFANLLGIRQEELKKNPMGYAKEFAQDTKSYLVLKGAPTVIFNPAGEAFINTTGNPGMAKFGTGDVLTGIIAGIMSQQNNIENALICAVYLHSLSADLLLNKFTEYGYTAVELLNNLPSAIKFLKKSFD